MTTEKRFIDLSMEEREEVLDKAWRDGGEWVDMVESRYVVDDEEVKGK